MTFDKLSVVPNTPKPTVEALKILGLQLDKGAWPEVWGNGIVKPGAAVPPSFLPGEGNTNGQGKSRSTAGTWQGAERGQGPAREPWAAGTAAPVFGGGTPSGGSEGFYKPEALSQLERDYPGSQIHNRADGFWLLASSSVLEGLPRQAIFLVAVPASPDHTAQSWAFWKRGFDYTAIGPRHTNFPYASICAFHVSDDVWTMGDSLVQLLDLYSVWALRHLHLEVFDRWPGPQVASWGLERLVESRPGELCCCGSLNKTYEECCKPKDIARGWDNLHNEFIASTAGGRRVVPQIIKDGVRNPLNLPTVAEFAMPKSAFLSAPGQINHRSV